MTGREQVDRRQVLRAVGTAGVAVGTTGQALGGSPGGTSGKLWLADTDGGRATECLWTNERSMDGQISTGESAVHQYIPERDEDSCGVEVSAILGVPPESEFDFDLYLTLDGRTPQPDDHDRASTGDQPDKNITLSGDEVTEDTELGLAIYATETPGTVPYELDVVETATGGCGVDSVFDGEWRFISEGEKQVHTLERQADYPCEVLVELTVPHTLDADAYLTLDGRTPTQEDYDRYTDSAGEGFSVAGDKLDPGDELGLLVVAVEVDTPDGSVDYNTTLSEVSDEPIQPVANLEILTENPVEDSVVEADGSESFARVGRSIESYEWLYKYSGFQEDKGTGTGETFSFVPELDGLYKVRLTITDDEGRSDMVQQTVDVEQDGDGGFCFITTATAREQATLDSLRRFRDDSMAATPLGRGLVGLYYRVSPPVARALDRHPDCHTARLCRWYVRRCAALSDRKREAASRPASAALGVFIAAIYILGVLIAMLGYTGIRLSELLS